MKLNDRVRIKDLPPVKREYAGKTGTIIGARGETRRVLIDETPQTPGGVAIYCPVECLEPANGGK